MKFLFLLLLIGVSVVWGREISIGDEDAITERKSAFLNEMMTSDGLKTVYGIDAGQVAKPYKEEGPTPTPEREPTNATYDYVPYRIAGTTVPAAKFILYTRNNSGAIVSMTSKEDLLEKGFDPNAVTKIICHGFLSSAKKGPAATLKPAYFNKATPEEKPLNVIAVDWSTLSGPYSSLSEPTETGDEPSSSFLSKQLRPGNLFYFPPAINTETVGNHTGEFIKFLVEELDLSLKNVHLIGHSLGAHVMGYAGRYVNDQLGDKVGRITGLDPAGPCFEGLESKFCFGGSYLHLRSSDADFVDAIHTNSGEFGMRNEVGHLDFYPNRGISQPGCPGAPLVWKAFCSHQRAIYLMEMTILRPDLPFISFNCFSSLTFETGICDKQRARTALMGEYCDPESVPGSYYLHTGERKPFVA